jgi:hypothetical protein
MKKTKLLDLKPSTSKSKLNNRSSIYKQTLQNIATDLILENKTRHRRIANELEIDIALSCLNACKYILAWIVFLCLYSSV